MGARRRKQLKRRLGRIEREMLEKLSLGDVLYGFLLSARSSRQMMRLARGRAKDRYRRKQAIERLRKFGYIAGAGLLSITHQGQVVLGAAITRNVALLKKRAWDNKWRIVAFDIPEQYSVLRDSVRTILKRAGFVKLQQSIWIFPHECQELVLLIKSDSRLSQYILYGTLERIENEEYLKKLFKLE